MAGGEVVAELMDFTFGSLTQCELAIVTYLYEHKGWVSDRRLNEATAQYSRQYDHAAPIRGVNTVHVQVHRIREKLGDGVVIRMRDKGYTLGAPGVRLYRAYKAAQAAFAAALASETQSHTIAPE